MTDPTTPDAGDASVEAEQAVLGAALLEPDTLDTIADLFRPLLFAEPAHAAIAEAILWLRSENKPPDPLLVAERLRVTGRIPGVVPPELPLQLVTAIGTTANVRVYAERLQDLALRRAVKAVAGVILRASPRESGASLLDRVANQLATLESKVSRPVTQLGTLIDDRIYALERQKTTGCAPIDLVPTGFASFDRMFGGLRVGHLTVIAARPRVGKTAFVSALADSIAPHAPCGIFMLEDYGDALADRAISRRAAIPSTYMRDGRTWLPEHWQRVGETFFLAQNALPIWVDDQHQLTIHDVTARMRIMKRKHGVRVCFLDNLAEVVIPDSDRRDVELGRVARLFRDAAKALDMVPVLIVHLNRGIEKRADQRPILSDLKNSGDIEDAAHLILMLHRTEDEPERLYVDATKNRNGPSGSILFRWVSEFMAVENLPQSTGL